MKKIRDTIPAWAYGEVSIRKALGDVLIGIPTFLAIITFFLILGTVVTYGWGVFAYNFPSFLTSNPYLNMRAGGIAPMIFGTFALVTGAMVIAIPLGVLASLYMSEYLTEGKLKSFINQIVNNLAGIPSIVFGLFGLSFFIGHLRIGADPVSGAGPNLVVGWLVLGFMALPIIVKNTNNALETVPEAFREASLALGATKWQTIWHNVMPYALPGILTGSILGVGRAAGETASGCSSTSVFSWRSRPWRGNRQVRGWRCEHVKDAISSPSSRRTTATTTTEPRRPSPVHPCHPPAGGGVFLRSQGPPNRLLTPAAAR